MQRSRVEALLASFPKLVGAGNQHTTVEQDNVRYVYQPLDELYIVLITNRQSNILQDIDSLHLFAQVISSICRSLDEREILRNAFELLSAFDELVSTGYRENLTLAQIKTFLDMESHEERVAMIIESVRPVYSNIQAIQLTDPARTNNSKPMSSASSKQSSSKCNDETKSVRVLLVPQTCPEHLHILHTLRQHNRQYQKTWTAMLRKRIARFQPLRLARECS